MGDGTIDGVPGRLGLYGPLLSAAREVLGRLDPDDVPAPLRRAAASSGRRLPPPLAAAVLRAIDADEWLRSEVLEAWDGGRAGAGAAGEASDLFLRRPPGWEERIEALDRAAAGRDAERRIAGMERERLRLQARLAALEKEVEEARAAAGRARGEAEARAEEILARLRRDVSSLRSRVRESERERDRLAARAVEAEERLEEAGRRIDALREARQRPPSVAPDAPRTVVGRGDPLATAQTLDGIVAALAAPVEEAGEETPAPPLTLPPSVRPDDASALDWLLGVERAVLLLVDGYNVAHALAGEPDADTRRRVEAEAARLRRLAAGPLSVVVFWDSALDESSERIGGVDVRYVPSADEAIIAAARSSSLPAVVVTSDRRVREACERAGAVGLWAEAWTGGR